MGIGQKELLVLTISIIFIVSMVSSTPFADAIKSSGTHLSEIGSAKICGDKLCVEPQSIQEKISEFLESELIKRDGVDKQEGRFSVGGASQQAFDLFDSISETSLDEGGKYNDDLLKISITPSSFWDLSVLGDTEDNRVVLFMSKNLNYQIFPPFFSIMKIQNSEILSSIVSESSFEEIFVKELTHQLSFIDAVSEIDNIQNSFSISDEKVQGEISGQIFIDVNKQNIPISFSTVVWFTPDGKTLASSLYSSSEDFSKSLTEFKNSIKTVSVESESTTVSEREPASISEPTPSPKSESTPSPKSESTPSPKSEPAPIPEWIKNNASWWGTGQIKDQDFTLGIEYMIKNEIINIPDAQKSVNTSTEKKSEPVIPDWVRNNALWWSEDLITENDFVKGLEWLIAQGIIEI